MVTSDQNPLLLMILIMEGPIFLISECNQTQSSQNGKLQRRFQCIMRKPPNTINCQVCHTCLQFHMAIQKQGKIRRLLSSVQSLSCVLLFATSWTAAPPASLSITNTQSLLKLMSIESVIPSNHLILCRPLLLLPSIFPSIRVFSNESVLPISWPQNWSFSISPSNEYSGLTSFSLGTNKTVISGQVYKYRRRWCGWSQQA